MNARSSTLLFAILSLFASTTLAQTSAGDNSAGSSAKDDFRNQPTTIRQRGTEALKLEQARSKDDLCATAKNNAAIGECLAAEGKTTEQHYLTYIRSIGALLRLDLSDTAKPAPHRLTFDAAEETWRTYCEQSCRSMATQWEGGDRTPIAYADCRLRLTWNHMNELDILYSDLWH